jgi:hypothetical protein
LVDGDDYDVPIGRLLDHRIKRFAVGRIDDDDVDAGRDEIAQIGDLLRWSTVAVGQNDLGNLTRRQGLGLDRADHFLTPTVADECIGNANHVLFGGRGLTSQAQNGSKKDHE